MDFQYGLIAQLGLHGCAMQMYQVDDRAVRDCGYVGVWLRYQFVGWLALLDPRTIENESKFGHKDCGWLPPPVVQVLESLLLRSAGVSGIVG